MPLFESDNVQFYYLYVSNGKLHQYDKYNLKHLNILRFDTSEKQIYDFRKNQHKDINENIIDLIKDKPKNTSKLSNIAFISRDFHERRPSGQLTFKFFKLLKELNPDINIFFYMYLESPISDYFKQLATIVAIQNIELLKDRILSDNIDILIDMQGHMHNNFNTVFKYRLAPIQMHWLGYPGTIGIDSIDYLVADETIVPKSSQPFYVEKMAYMPNCYQCNNDDLLITESNLKRSDFNIPYDAFVFCHFNHEYKLDRKTWFVWMSILQRVPNSVLVFTVFNPNFCQILYHDAKLNGVDKNRVIFLGYERNREKHFNRINLCDLGLDCYRLNGHTSSSDLIASGIPLITYTSETYHNRVAKSILKAIDLEELVCYSFDEYADLAVRLATNKNYYNLVRNKVLENRTKFLFNTKLYVENFMKMLNTIWDEKVNEGENEETCVGEDIMDEEKRETESNKQLAVINKDYNLPVINLVFNDYETSKFNDYLFNFINYIANQNYLNLQLNIIISKNIAIKTIMLLKNIDVFHNIHYYSDDSYPSQLVNVLHVNKDNFDEIVSDIKYIQKYYENNKDTLVNIILNETTVSEVNLNELYDEKIQILENLPIEINNLENLPCVYWINLERSEERKNKMNALFSQYNIENTRISAHDYLCFDDFCANNADEIYDNEIQKINEEKNKSLGQISDKNKDIKGAVFKLFSSVFNKDFDKRIDKIENAKNNKKKELSCMSSHLKAMKTFLESSDDEYCIIVEDDFSIEYVKYWQKTFWEYLEELPDDWECVQLTQIIPLQQLSQGRFLIDRIKVLPYKDNFSWSTTAYMINRKGAQKILDSVSLFDDKFYFKQLDEAIADVYIYKYANTYTIPLFTYTNEDDSTINNNVKHMTQSKNAIDNSWIFDYEKYKEEKEE